jgi:hypothetical protein
MKLAKLRRDTEASVATLGRRSAEFPTGATLSDFLEWFRAEVAVMSTTFVECNKNITCYALICVFQMLAGEGREHLLELKKLALSCDASVLQDFPVEAGWIAKRLVKNWWTKHGLPYCMQKIEEENRVSFGTLSLEVTLCMPLFNFLFLISLKLMKVSKVVMATSMSSLSVMAHKRRFFCAEPPLLGWLGITLWQRRMCRRRLPRLMRSPLLRCECLRVDLFLDGWCYV